MVHEREKIEGVNFHQPPRGVTYNATHNELDLKVSHRSIGGALVTLFLALFWNGIVSVFVVMALLATLVLAGISIPEWLPAPEMDVGSMGLGMTIFLWLFLTPFILIGLAILSAFFLALGGRTAVTVNGEAGRIFTGVGPIGTSKHFTRSEVVDVGIDTQHSRGSRGGTNSQTHIYLEQRSGKKIKFGSTFSAERRKFVVAAVRRATVR